MEKLFKLFIIHVWPQSLKRIFQPQVIVNIEDVPARQERVEDGIVFGADVVLAE